MIRNQLTDKSHEYLSVEDALARNNNVFITGAGGTGKSFLILAELENLFLLTN